MTTPDTAAVAAAAFELWFDPDWLTMIPMDAFAAGFERGRLLNRVADLASQMRASFPADYPEGAQASFADWLRTYGRADLLDGDGDD